jgi:protein phosphatase
MNTKLVPLNCLIITVGPSLDYNEKVLSKWFSDYEIINVEDIRYQLSGDRNRQDIEKIVFSEINHMVETKLKIGERVIVNAYNLRSNGRIALANIALSCGAPVFYLVCYDSENPDKNFLSSEREILRGDGVAEVIDLRCSDLYIVKKIQNIDDIREKFDGLTIVGDVHGMHQSLLAAIDWAKSRRHFLLFMGDIIDYGPGTLECADEVYRTVMRGNGELIVGNHERKIAKWIDQPEKTRYNLKLSDGNKVTTQSLMKLSPYQREQWMARFRGLVYRSPLLLKLDKYVFTHAAVHPSWWTPEVDRKEMELFSLFGEFEKSAMTFSNSNKPKRTYDWVNSIPSEAVAFVGHDARSYLCPVTKINELGGTAVFLDTGSGKGGFLSSVDLRFTNQGPKMIFSRH